MPNKHKSWLYFVPIEPGRISQCDPDNKMLVRNLTVPSLQFFPPSTHPLLVLWHGHFWRLPLHWSESVGSALTGRKQLSTDLWALPDPCVTQGVAVPTARVRVLHQCLRVSSRSASAKNLLAQSQGFPSPTQPETLGWGPENLFEHGTFFGCRKHLGNHSSTTSSGPS